MPYFEPLHDHSYFYKYVTSDVSKLILKNKTFRWSSPFTFNDPFDMQFNVRFDFNFDEIDDIIFNRFKSLVRSNLPVPNYTIHPHAMKIEAIRQMVQINNMTEEALDKLFGGDVILKNTLRGDLLPDLQEHCMKEAEGASVFCVSQTNNNLLMWSHYAAQHTGVVLQLRCIPELDTPLCAAKAVVYARSIPKICTATEWIDSTLGVEDFNFEKIWDDLTYTKSVDWAYEMEWRVVSELKNKEGTKFELIPFYPEELCAIYLGCRISNHDKEEIRELISRSFPHVRIFQATKADKVFAVAFSELP